jgi:hypothetical protein
MSETRIEYRVLDDVVEAERNPKDHDLGAVITSIRRFGFVNPAVEDSATGRLVAGHGRLAALRAMHEAGEAAPAGIGIDDAGRWHMPIVVGARFVTEAEAEAYVVADNRLVELGGWDEPMLAEILGGLDLDGVGFDADDLERMAGNLGEQAEAESPGSEPEAAQALAERWGTAEGQVWSISSTSGGLHLLRVDDPAGGAELLEALTAAGFGCLLATD